MLSDIGSADARGLVLARLANGLKDAELRVLLWLNALDPGPPHHSVRVSSRKLVELSGVARSNVQKALDSLEERCIITIRQGSATKAAAILLNFAKTVPMERGPNLGPPRPQIEATLALFQGHPGPDLEPLGGPTVGPPPTENKGLAGTGSRVDISTDSIRTIDRLLKANAKSLDPSILTHFRGWLHGYMCKFGQPNAHPPDDRIVAQFLSIAPAEQLGRLLDDLMAERKEAPYSYAWFVAVAMQRLHGIQPAALKARRAELRLVRAGAKTAAPAAPPQQQPLVAEKSDAGTPTLAVERDPDFARGLVKAAAAGVKSL